MQTYSIRELSAAASKTKALQGLRRFLQIACANLVYTRRLPRTFKRHPVYVTPSATLEYLLPSPWCFDAALLRFAAEYVQEDSVVWDIGANVGAFSVAAASRATGGSVLAVDADPLLISLLQRTASHRRNKDLSIHTLCCAIGASQGIAEFCIAQNGRASSYLRTASGRTTTGGVVSSQTVPIVTLDSLSNTFKPPSILKIDVEGAESQVLEGGVEIMRNIRPVMLIEVGVENQEHITSALRAAEYTLLSGNMPDFGCTVESCVSNTIALPQ